MSPATDSVVLDDLTVDLIRRRVARNGANIPISALSFNTLQALIEAAPEPLSPDELIDRAWQGAVVTDEAVTQRIRLLRQALGDDTRQPRYIETLRSAGYRLVPPVQSASVPRRRSGPLIAAAAVVIVAVAMFAMGGSQDAAAPDPDTADPGTPEPATTDSTSETAIPQGPLTADELVERAHVLMGQRSPSSLSDAIAMLESAHELEPEHHTAQASLALALALSVAWYNEPKIRAHRAEELARNLLVERRASFDAQLALGLALDAQGQLFDAQSAYERAVALDPDRWGARASLAYLLQVQGRLVEALFHNLRAMDQGGRGKLDVQVASNLRLLGFESAATEWLDRALRLEPGSAHAAPTRALDLLGRGEHEMARQIIAEALQRGVQQSELYEYGMAMALAEEDLAAARRIFESAPGHHREGVTVGSWGAVISALEGRPQPALDRANAFQQAIESGDSWPDNHLYVAMLFTVAGRNDEALASLDRLFAVGYRDHRWIEAIPIFRSLDDPTRFQGILQAMREDIDQQRAEVLTASWFPDELRPISSPPPAG